MIDKHRNRRFRVSCRAARWSRASAMLLLLGIAGCDRPAPVPPRSKGAPEISVVHPERGPLRWSVRQPGYIEAFEQTLIVPRIAGYVEKWNVDIGDSVEKGDILAVLWVPDMVKDLDQRRSELDQARKLFDVAEAHVASMATVVVEAQAGVGRARANFLYRKLQHDRVSQLLEQAAVNKKVQDESLSELQSAEAGFSEAQAKVARAMADKKESEAVRDKTRVDIAVAKAALEKAQALVDYATLKAPFDGVVARRTVNTGDFVQPPAGAQKDALYLIEHRDVMRVFVEVPEADAVWVKNGAPAHVVIPNLMGREIREPIKRISYSLKRQTRTLIAEIDLPNPGDLLRPGMYVSAVIELNRADLLTLPADSIAKKGDVNEGFEHFCFMVENGRLRRTAIEIGALGEGRVQVLKKHVEGAWLDFSGTETVIRGALADLTDGEEVALRWNGKAALRLAGDAPTPRMPP